ncbi:MAG TPA: hypothetical protein VD928_03535 [Candidatus Paceibacterota bacterium]|nr:hypothetical protein [Candidatus Paceibacterota bacterium]
MSGINIVVTKSAGHVIGVSTFARGFKKVKCPHKEMSEDDILAMALRFEHQGNSEAADEVLERYFAGYRFEVF